MYTFTKYAWWFVVPALLLIAVFALYPVLNTLVLSFLHYDLHENAPRFAGLKNYVALFADQRAGLALVHTLVFTVGSVALELVFGMALALLLRQKVRGAGPARAFAMVPWAMPAVVAALLWRWIFNDESGLLNTLLLRIGVIGTPVPFLSAPWWSTLAVVVCEVWKTTPFMAILLLAGLQMVPEELYESARVDGATVWQRFRFITLPLIAPAVLIALLFRTMDALRIFDTVFVLTGGGPGNATETISLYTYKTMFSYLQFGRGSALAIATFALVAVVSAGYLVLLRREEE